MYRDIFSQYLKDINNLNENELTLVTYDKEKHLLTYRQLNKIIMLSYLSPYFFPKKRFTYGVLTPNGLNSLKIGLTKLLGDTLMDNELLIPDIRILGMSWYRHFNDITLPIPQEYIKLDFVNVTSRIISNLLCRRFNENSKIMIKSLKREIKLEKVKSTE